MACASAWSCWTRRTPPHRPCSCSTAAFRASIIRLPSRSRRFPREPERARGSLSGPPAGGPTCLRRLGYRSTAKRLTGQSAKGGAVDLDDTPQQVAYREQVRNWLQQHKPEAPVLSGPNALREESEIIAARRAWQGKLAEGGLA